MKIRVPISKNGQEGMVEYDSVTQKAVVTFPDEDIQEEIEDYLDSPRVFRIPIGPGIDEDRKDRAKPIDNDTYFNLAMCAMYSSIGVWVLWEGEEIEE